MSIDLKSRIGYYVEKVTACNLCKLMLDNNYSFGDNDILISLNNEMESYKNNKIIPLFNNCSSKLNVAYNQGLELSNKIFNNIDFDMNGIYDIILCGESMKFETKADIVIKNVVTNKSLFISLKAYKGYNINLLNYTFVSFIKNLMFPHINGNGKIFINNLISNLENENLNDHAAELILSMPIFF